MPTPTTDLHPASECARIAADLHALRAPFTQTYPSDAAHLRALELAFQTAIIILHAPQAPAPSAPRAAAWRAGFQHMRGIIGRALSRFRPRAAPPSRQHQADRALRPSAAQPSAPSPSLHSRPATPETPTPVPHSPEPPRPERHPDLRSPDRATPEAGAAHDQPSPDTSRPSRCQSSSPRPGCGQNRRWRSNPARRPASMCNRRQPHCCRAARATRINLQSPPGVRPRPP